MWKRQKPCLPGVSISLTTCQRGTQSPHVFGVFPDVTTFLGEEAWGKQCHYLVASFIGSRVPGTCSPQYGGSSSFEIARVSYQVQEAANNTRHSTFQLGAIASRVHLQHLEPLGLHSVWLRLWGSNRQGLGRFCGHLTWDTWTTEMFSWPAHSPSNLCWKSLGSRNGRTWGTDYQVISGKRTFSEPLSALDTSFLSLTSSFIPPCVAWCTLTTKSEDIRQCIN